jgi:PAS domain S-box-containing protein
MFKAIRGFLAPPIFADEEQTRQANLLNIILIAVMIILIMANVLSLVISLANNQGLTNLTGSTIGVLIMGLAFYLMRQGHVRLSSTMLVGVIIGVVTIGITTSNGVRSPTAAGYVVAIVAAGLLLGGRSAIIATGTSLFMMLGVNALETNGWIVVPSTEIAATSIAVTYTSVFVAMAILLRLATNSIEQALGRARTNEQEVRTLASTLEHRVAERTRALEASAEVSRRLSTILDPDQLVLEVVEQVKSAYNYYHAHIYLLDESGQSLQMVGGTGEAGKILLERGHAIPVGRGVVGQAAQLKRGILVPDTSKEAGWLPNPLLPDTKAEIAVPILLRDQVIGVLDVQDDVTDDVFPEDVELLQAIANQVAVALQNARQYEETQRLFQAGQMLAAATDYHTILDTFMRYGTPQADQGGLVLFNKSANDELLSVEYAAAWSHQADRPQPVPVGTLFAPERVPFLSSIMSSQPLIVTDVNQRRVNPQAVTTQVADLLTLFGMQAMVSLPLILGGQRIGALLIGYAQPHTFGEQELRPAQTLANQITILLQNQRLLEEAQTTLEQLNLVNRRLTGQAWQEFTESTGHIMVEDVIPGTTSETNEPLAPQAELIAPIQVRGEAIGHLRLQHLDSDIVFSEDDQTLLHEVASEMAIALENVRLVEQTRRNAAALEESRSLLDSVVENLPLLLFVKEAQELRYVRWNKAGEEMLGISADEVLGKNAYDSFTPEEADRFTAQDREVLQQRDSLDIAEETVVTPRGTRILHTRKTPVFGPDGQSQYLIGLSDDITERKQAEQALQELEALYRRAIAAADAVPYSRRYQDETFTFVGEQIEALTGYPAQEFTAALFDSLIEEIITHENVSSSPAESVQIARSGKIAHWKADYRIRGRDGEERWLADTSVEVLGPDGTSTGSVGILTDITERKRTERALSRQLVEMEILNAIGQILTAEKDLNEMLIQVGQQISATFKVNTSQISLYDNHAQIIRTPFALHSDEQIEIAPQPLGKNLVSLVIQSRQPLYIPEMSQAKVRQLDAEIDENSLAACWLGVPILSGDELIGVISLQHAEDPNWFNERDIRLLVTLANNLSTAIQNIRLFTQTQTALAELEALTRRLTHEGWESYLTETAQQQQMSYLFDGNQVTPFETNGHSTYSPLPEKSNQTFVQSVTIHGEQIGRLVAEDIDIETSEFQAIIQAVSQGLSTHIDNLRLNEQTERALAEARKRSEELDVLNEMGRALTTANSVDDIVQHLQFYLPQLVPANDFYVALNHPETNEVEIRVFINGAPYSHFTREWSNGVTEYMLRERQPLLIRGNLAEIADEKGFEVIGRLTEAFMGVPMIVGQDTLGVIASQNETEPHTFTENHLDLLTAVASQTAIAISNVYLLTQTQVRAEELALINRVVSSVASSLDIRQSMQIVAQELGHAAAVEQIGIALFNEDRTALTVIAELYDPERSVSALGFVIPVEGNLSTQEVMRTRKPLLIPDALTSPLTAAFHDGLRSRGVQSLAIFPMIVGNEMIGTIGVDILETGRTLTANQIRLVETIIYQASIAVDNARLFEQTEQALKEVRTLYDVSIQLNAARTLPEALLALSQPAMDNGASASGMFTFELDEQGQPQWGVVAAAWQRTGPPPIPVSTRFHLPDFPTARLWLENPNKVVFFEDMFTDERVDAATQALYRQTNAQAAIWIPLVAQSRWLGLIYISWSESRRFSPGEQRLYESLRTQGTAIVENRLLYEQSQARAAELGVINQVAEIVARQLDPVQVMESVYRQIQRVVVADAFLIGLYNAAADHITYPILYDNGQRYEQTPVTRDAQSIIFQVIDTGKPVFINRTPEELAEFQRQAAPTVGAPGLLPASIIYVPLFSGAQVIGAMSVQSYEPNAYDEGDLTLLIGIASHVAVAMENARLFAQTQERAAELTTINEMSRIASSQLSLSALTKTVGEQLERTFQASGVYIALYEKEHERIIFPYFLETDDGQRKLLDIAPRPLDAPGVTGRIIKTRQPILVSQDTQTQMLALGATTTGTDTSDVQSYLGVPMIIGEDVVGVIAVQNDAGERIFTEADQNLLLTLATTIGVAVQNARQFELTQRRAQRERLLNEITQKIQGTHTMEGALQTAVKELGQALKAKYISVDLAAEPLTNGNNGD